MNSQNIRDNQIMGGNNSTYRKVFKPNLGGPSSNMSDRNRKVENNMRSNTIQAESKPSTRPPLNSRLKQKITQRNNGVYDGTDEHQVEYEPTKRTGSLRSSRVTNPSTNKSNRMNNHKNEIGNNVPRASKPPKQSFGGMSKSNKNSNGYGRGLDMQKNVPNNIQNNAKVGASSDPVDFGEEAYEKPSDLRPCPSCGRSFNEEALVKHKKV